jgi:Domain of unknown function (DUF4326)
MKPIRIQRKRTKGWAMPENTVCVDRSTRWGNPFTVENCRDAGYKGTDSEVAKRCVGAFKVWLGPMWRNNWDGEDSERQRANILDHIDDLRGKNLACWCKLDQPCHADVLLELANE